MLKSILSKLDQLSLEELSTLNDSVVRMAKAKRRFDSVSKGASLYTGQKVQVNHPKYKGMTFTITKVNRTRVKIIGGRGKVRSFNCPISMIEA